MDVVNDEDIALVVAVANIRDLAVVVIHIDTENVIIDLDVAVTVDVVVVL